MIFLELRQWLDGAAACLPALRAKRLMSRLEALERLGTQGNWEVGLSGGDCFSALSIRYFGAGADYAGWTRACAALFGVSLKTPDFSDPRLPWAAFCWDLAKDRWTSLTFYGARRLKGRGAPQAAALTHRPGKQAPREMLAESAAFDAKDFGDPLLEKALREFSRLCRLGERIYYAPPAAARRALADSWELRLDENATWPAFLRCDLSSAFTAHSAQIAFLMRDRNLRALAFDGEALWAYTGD